jgi:hypothetical protein
MAGFLKSAMILEDYRAHGSGAFVFVLLILLLKR